MENGVSWAIKAQAAGNRVREEGSSYPTVPPSYWLPRSLVIENCL